MDKLLSVAEMVLPVLVMIGIGSLARKTKIIDKSGLDGLKAVISRITIPVVLFLAFYSVEYSLKSVLLLFVIYLANVLALGLGYLTRRFVGENHKLMPFLISGYEAGMLGYALFTLLCGAENRHYFASVDIGQTIFVYTIYLAALTSETGGKPTLKGITVNMFTNPAFLGAIFGMIFGIFGLGKLINSSPFSAVFRSVLDFITTPTAAVILIIIGYELSLKVKLIKPVLKTILLRIVVMGALLAAAAGIVFLIIPFNKTLLMAMILMFSLPAPFIIPLYANVESEADYISTTLSLNTVVTIAIFTILAFIVV